MREWDLYNGGEAAVQARLRSRTVDSRDGSFMSNPVADLPNIEMVQLSVAARKAKRRSYKKRQATLKRLNYRQSLDGASAGTKTASYTYVAADADEIDLQEGDVLQGVRKLGNGWFEGKNTRTGETGAFPASFAN